LTFGTLTAAHVDGLFNNASEWEHLRATHISYTLFFASHGNEGAEGHGELIFAGAPDAPEFLPADFNQNGTVDFPDFLVLSEAFGTTVDPAGTDPDIDGSGTVDFADFLVLSESFGQSSVATAAVPEPNSLGLLMLGALTLGLVRRRR
jgi:hypothetical protein